MDELKRIALEILAELEINQIAYSCSMDEDAAIYAEVAEYQRKIEEAAQ
jgi:hypothetical protein